jgi:hypothetical protein
MGFPPSKSEVKWVQESFLTPMPRKVSREPIRALTVEYNDWTTPKNLERGNPWGLPQPR